MQKTLNYEWATARFELYLYAGNSKGTISELGRAALKNSQGYPYRRHRLIDLLTDNTSYLLGEGDWIGCKLDTFDLALGINDVITITGCWKQEVILVPEQQLISNVINVAASASPTPSPTPVPVGDITVTNQFTNDSNTTAQATQIADLNSKRKSLSVTLISGSSGGGYIYKIDASPVANFELYWGVIDEVPLSFFEGYTGRVTMQASTMGTLVAEVIEVSNP